MCVVQWRGVPVTSLTDLHKSLQIKKDTLVGNQTFMWQRQLLKIKNQTLKLLQLTAPTSFYQWFISFLTDRKRKWGRSISLAAPRAVSCPHCSSPFTPMTALQETRLKLLKFDTTLTGLIQDRDESGSGAAGPLVHLNHQNLLGLSGPVVEVPHEPCLTKGLAEVVLPVTDQEGLSTFYAASIQRVLCSSAVRTGPAWTISREDLQGPPAPSRTNMDQHLDPLPLFSQTVLAPLPLGGAIELCRPTPADLKADSSSTLMKNE